MKRVSPQHSPSESVDTNMMAVAALERDTELMLRVRDGDSASFGLLLERHRGPVIHFLYRMVQNQAIAEELAQDTNQTRDDWLEKEYEHGPHVLGSIAGPRWICFVGGMWLCNERV
jgi:hypothetical protein